MSPENTAAVIIFFEMQQAKKNSKQQSKPKQQQKKQRRPPQTMVVQMSNAPVSKGTRGRVPSPQIMSGKDGRITVRHAELLGTLSSTSDDFSVLSLSINPGLVGFTGWLSNIAQNYESYRFKQLKFRYVPACSTTTAGQVFLSVDFDSADQPPATESQLSYYQGTRYCSPWDRCEYVCTSANLSKRKSYYVRGGPLPANSDVLLYDTGKFLAASVGTGTASLGKLWVEYEVEFSTPDYPITAAGRSLSGKYSGNDNFATTPAVTGNLPLTATVAANVLTLTALQPYSGVCAFNAVGTGITLLAVAGTGGEGLKNSNINSGGTGISATITLQFNAGQTATFTLSATTVSAVALRIGQYDVVISG